MKLGKYACLVAAALGFSTLSVLANDLKVEHISLQQGKEVISFDVSWIEAWKNHVNCDGAYLFAKYRIGDGAWKHVTLKSSSKTQFNYTDQTPTGFSKGTGGTSAEMGMWVPATQKGLFIFRTQGQGDVRTENVSLVWDIKKDGVTKKDLGKAEIRVLGLEMVYVPQAPFYLGDPDGPDGPANCFYTYYNAGAYYVKSEDSIKVDAKEGYLYSGRAYPPEVGKNSRDEVPFTIPAEFPKGYNAFWIMKYEMDSQHYVDFLNLLTRKQQQARVASDISGDKVASIYVMTNTPEERLRNNIVCMASGNGTDKPIVFSTKAPSRVVNFIEWADQAAYADWAALRPLTEMEYEKTCRGTAKPIPNEYAWGTTRIGRVEAFKGVDGSGQETKLPDSGIVNACFDGGIGPMHRGKQAVLKHEGFVGAVSAGLFARTQHEGVPKRENDGAAFYGALELSGNAWDVFVTLGHPKGRAFQRVSGDGELDANGDASVPTWPAKDAQGIGARGGVWVSPGAIYLCMARRQAGADGHVGRRENGSIRLGF